jgi:hypothetical protein
MKFAILEKIDRVEAIWEGEMFARNPGHDRWPIMVVVVLAIGLLLAMTMLVHGM